MEEYYQGYYYDNYNYSSVSGENWPSSNSEISDCNSSEDCYYNTNLNDNQEKVGEAKKVTKWQKKRAFEMTLPLHIRQKRRLAANARERKRMTSLNQAFEKLREILPNQDHRDRPLSKMEALQMAQNYIKELSLTLQYQDHHQPQFETDENIHNF